MSTDKMLEWLMARRESLHIYRSVYLSRGETWTYCCIADMFGDTYGYGNTPREALASAYRRLGGPEEVGNE